MATELVSHIDVCLVHGVQCILPPTSRMRFELTQKEIPLGGESIIYCKQYYALLSNSLSTKETENCGSGRMARGVNREFVKRKLEAE